DGVDGEGGLPRLAVADDQLPLTAADVDHAVDGLDAGLQRLAHRLPCDDAGGDALDGGVLLRAHRPAAVDRLAERVHDPAHHRVPHRHRHDAAGAPDLVALLDVARLAEEHRSDGVLLQVEGDAGHAVGQLEQLARHAALEPVQARDAVSHRHDGTHLGDVHPRGEAPELLADDPADLVGANVHVALAPRVPFQGAAQGLQPAPDGAVIRAAAHLQEHATEDGGIDPRPQLGLEPGRVADGL